MIVVDTDFHIRKAERNEDFFQSSDLRASSFNEWGVVVLFYGAVHYVDAVLAQEFNLPTGCQHPHEHSERNTGVAQSLRLNTIYGKYKRLHDRSRDARYNCISFAAGTLSDLETTCFEPIKSCVRTSLRLP